MPKIAAITTSVRIRRVNLSQMLSPRFIPASKPRPPCNAIKLFFLSAFSLQPLAFSLFFPPPSSRSTPLFQRRPRRPPSSAPVSSRTIRTARWLNFLFGGSKSTIKLL